MQQDLPTDDDMQTREGGRVYVTYPPSPQSKLVMWALTISAFLVGFMLGAWS